MPTPHRLEVGLEQLLSPVICFPLGKKSMDESESPLPYLLEPSLTNLPFGRWNPPERRGRSAGLPASFCPGAGPGPDDPPTRRPDDPVPAA